MPADVPSAAAKGWMTTEEVAELIGRAPRTVRLLAESGSLAAVRAHPRMWLFDRDAVEEFAAQRDSDPAA